MDFRCVHLIQFFNICDPHVSFPDFTRVQCITEKNTWQDFCSKLMQSRLVSNRNWVIFDLCSTRDNEDIKWYSEPPFVRCLSHQTIDLECFADSGNIPCTSTSSARSPCNLGSQTDVAISVLREASKNAVPTWYHLCSRLQR